MNEISITELKEGLLLAKEEAKPYTIKVDQFQAMLENVCDEFISKCYHQICKGNSNALHKFYDLAKFYPFDIKSYDCKYEFHEKEIIISYEYYDMNGYDEVFYTHIPWNYLDDISDIETQIDNYIEQENKKKIEKERKKLEKLQSKINTDINL